MQGITVKSSWNIVRSPWAVWSVDDYAKDDGPEAVWLLCSFYNEPLRTWIKTNVNKFAISNHTALKLDVQTLRNYFSLICEYELYILPNKKVGTAKDHGKNYMKDRQPLVRNLSVIVYYLILGLMWSISFLISRDKLAQILNRIFRSKIFSEPWRNKLVADANSAPLITRHRLWENFVKRQGLKQRHTCHNNFHMMDSLAFDSQHLRYDFDVHFATFWRIVSKSRQYEIWHFPKPQTWVTPLPLKKI